MREGVLRERIRKILIDAYGVPSIIAGKKIHHLVDEVKSDLGKDIYGFATIHDLPRLQKKFEKWFGEKEVKENERL